MKGATEFSYANGGGTINYGCLNGRKMTAYVDQYGHLHPQIFVGGIPGSCPPGIGSALTGFPPESNIGTDGQIFPTANIPGYSLLRSYEDRTYESSTRAAIVGRRELITLGTGGVVASWGIKGDHADLQAFGGGLIPTDGTPGAFSVAGAVATGEVSANSSVVFVESGGGLDLLEVALAYSFQNDDSELEQVRIKVEVTLTDLFGSGLTGVTFGFAIDPNPGFTAGTATTQFFTPTDLDAFAVNGTLGFGEHCVGLGVYEVEGAILGYSTNIVEASITRQFDATIAASPNIRLGSGTNATRYSGNTLISSTTNWKTDTAWRAALPSVAGDYSVFLRSPEMDIGAGLSETFTFYIFTVLSETEAGATGTRSWAYAN